MGWFWQSSTLASQAPPPASAAAQNQTATPAPTAPPKPAEQVDPEILKFWEMLQADDNPPTKTQTQPPPAQHSAPSSPPSPAAPEPQRSSWSWGWPSSSSKSSSPPTTPPSEPQQQPTTTPHLTAGRSPASLALSETQLPTTMSCRDAFDYAFHCNTPGGQFTSVYRYGSARTCSDLWDDFWFCMRVKSYAPEAKAAAIRAHFRAKEEAKYGVDVDTGRRKPSSEDVWESRDRLVERGAEFAHEFPRSEEDDAKMQREEMEYRRRVKEELFGKKK